MDDLNEACARAMEWDLATDEHGGVWVVDGGNRYELPDFYHIDSLIQARWLEDEIERRGRVEPYTVALWQLVNADFSMMAWDTNFEANLWLVLRATPEQRARAFLQAVA